MFCNYNYHQYTKSKFLLFIVLLWATKFCGLAPIASLYPSGLTYEIPVFLIMIFIGHKKVANCTYKKWYLLLLLSLVLNYCSTIYFEDTTLVEAVRGASFVHYLFIFFVFAYLNPSICDIEDNIKIIGSIELVLYFVQRIILPTPILVSLTTGWRSNDDINSFDILRFTVTGELIMFLFLFLAFNKVLLYHKNRYYLPIILILIMCILHGYRSVLVAMLVCLCIQYIWIKGFHLNKTTINLTVVIFTVLIGITNIPFISEIWQTMEEKQENEFNSLNDLENINRIVEFHYFFDHQIKNLAEWVFGCGFIGISIDRGVRAYQGWINWADLGFLGLSFMGGIFMAYCWIRLLILNIRKNTPHAFIYIPIFSLFVLFSTMLLPTGFIDQAPVIQALALFLGYKIFVKKQQ